MCLWAICVSSLEKCLFDKSSVHLWIGLFCYCIVQASQVSGSDSKESTCNAGDLGSIP